MKAVTYSEYGGPEVLEISDIPKPAIKPDQVLVENYASSINPFDFKVRNGWIEGLPSSFPITIGGDFSGKIIEVGGNVTGCKVGDEIYGQASVFGGASGSMAEYLSANTRSFSIKPSNLDFIHSSSLPLVGASAIQAIEDHIGLKRGQKLFVNGGSGGIGSVAIQIAKYIGAYVVTSVSTENVDFVNSLGSDEVIDYKKEKVSGEDFDVVFDASGLKLDESLIKILKEGGILVSMGSLDYGDLADRLGVNMIAQDSKVTTDRLDRLREYVEKEVVKTNVEKIFGLEETRKAYEYQENSKVRGKVVVKIK